MQIYKVYNNQPISVEREKNFDLARLYGIVFKNVNRLGDVAIYIKMLAGYHLGCLL